MFVHVHYKSFHFSQPSSAKQQREMGKFVFFGNLMVALDKYFFDKTSSSSLPRASASQRVFVRNHSSKNVFHLQARFIAS